MFATYSPAQGLTVTTIAAFLQMHLQPFTSDFPRADIYEMISPDLLQCRTAKIDKFASARSRFFQGK